MTTNRKYILLLAAVCCAAIAMFAPALSAPPMIDDIPQLQHVSRMDDMTSWLGRDCFGFLRPIKNLLFLFFLKVAATSPSVWRLIVLIVYAVNICLLFMYALCLTSKRSTAFTAAAVWAFSPTNISSVSWLSCVNIQIMVSCVLGALIFYELSRQKRSWRVAYLLSIVFFLVGLAAYEMALTFAGLVLIGDYFFHRERTVSRLSLKYYAAYILIAIAYCVLYFFSASGKGPSVAQIAPTSSVNISLSSAYFMIDHFSLWLWPFGRQSIMGTFTFGGKEMLYNLVISWLTVAFMIYAVVRLRNCMPYVGFGLCWFMIAFAPVSNLIPMFNGPFADYYLGLPSIGLSIAVASIISDIWPASHRPSPLRPAFASVLILFILLSRLCALSLMPGWVRAWKSEKSILARSLMARPDSFAAKLALATVMFRHGDRDEAVVLARQAVAEAPWRIQGYYSLADMLRKNGDYDEALSVHAAIAESWPENAVPWVISGTIYEYSIRDKGRAMECYRKALALPWDPAYSSTAAMNLAGEYTINGEPQKGLEILLESVRRAPDEYRLHQSIAVTAQRAGKKDLAVTHAAAAAGLGAPLDEKTLGVIHESE